MEMVVMEIKQGRINAANNQQQNNNEPGGATSILIQQEIIQKERKIFDLERRLRHKDEEIDKLKAERDRLLQISNDLRAELNNTQRMLQEREQMMNQDLSEEYLINNVNQDDNQQFYSNRTGTQYGDTAVAFQRYSPDYINIQTSRDREGRSTADFLRRSSINQDANEDEPWRDK